MSKTTVPSNWFQLTRWFILPLLFLLLLLAACTPSGNPPQPDLDLNSPLIIPIIRPSATPSATAELTSPLLAGSQWTVGEPIGGPIVSVFTTTGGVNIVGVATDSLPVTLVAAASATPSATPLATSQATVQATVHPLITPRPSATPDWVPAITPTPERVWYLVAAQTPASAAAPDGRTIQSAWRAPEQVRWDLMAPWDELRVGPGFHGGTLRPATDYVQIRPLPNATAPAYFSGGRTSPLPECNQPSWDANYLGDDYGIWIEDVTGVVIDGGPDSLIHLRDYRYGAIRLEPSSRAVHLRNLRVYNNGTGIKTATGWRPARSAIIVGGRDHTLGPNLVVKNNGEDAIQSRWGQNNLSGLLVVGNWLYNSRLHSSGNGLPFNWCTHSDSVQVYSGDIVRNIIISNNVLGPNVTNGAILGDKGTRTVVHNVLIADNRFLHVNDNPILDNSPDDVDALNWRVERNLIFD